MKKKTLLLLLPLTLLLSSCGEIKVGFLSNDDHSAGLDKSISSSNNEKIVYSYMSNTSLDKSDLNEVSLTFVNIDDAYSDIQDEEMIKSFFSLSEEIVTSISNPHYVGTRDDGSLFIGADSSYVDGELSINFSKSIKKVEVTARPYYFVKTAYNEEQLIVDENVAIAINSSGYIRLDTSKDEENVTSKQTVCGFDLANQSETITIKVGQRRAIIEKINFYY